MPGRTSFDRSVFWMPDGPVEPELEATLRARAPSLMAYAEWYAWFCFQDEWMAAPILETALDVVSRRFAGKPIPPESTLQNSLRDEVRRCAKQASRKRRVEEIQGNLYDLADKAASGWPDLERRIFVKRLFDELNPNARQIANMLNAGYSWREIGSELGVDHSGARRAFGREVDKVLKKMGVSRACFEKPSNLCDPLGANAKWSTRR